METIRRQISDAISVVVYLGVDPESGARKILEVAELGSAADGQIQLSPTFTWCRKERSWRLGISRFNDLLKGVM
jgi:Flp pilus assembly CpaF family ATPase